LIAQNVLIHKKQKILLISPHLDDAIFSMGAIAAELAGQGHKIDVLTCFTKSVMHPTGFALACQLDKNLPADIDYMELRRQEDQQACQLLGIEPHWGNLLEAPHRGYDSAKELFQVIKKQDKIAEKLLELIENQIEELQPEFVFFPKGIGNHVDHQQVINALTKIKEKYPKIFYLQWYDQPYLLRNPGSWFEKSSRKTSISAKKLHEISEENGQKPVYFDLKSVNMLKFQACAAYASQVNFQFGSEDNLAQYFMNSDSEENNFIELLESAR